MDQKLKNVICGLCRGIVHNIPYLDSLSMSLLRAELGNVHKLPFLDTVVTFNSNSFSIHLYRKKTFKGLYYDFGSLMLLSCKVNLVRSLIFRSLIFRSFNSFRSCLSRVLSSIFSVLNCEKLLTFVMSCISALFLHRVLRLNNHRD